MAAGQWTIPTAARTSLFNGTFDLDSDSFKIALVDSGSNVGAGSTTWAGVTNELATAFGYTAGGQAVTVGLSGTTTITWTLADTTWTASGGSIVARWAVIYEVGGNVLAFMLLDATPADVTTTDGNQLKVLGTNNLATVTFA